MSNGLMPKQVCYQSMRILIEFSTLLTLEYYKINL